MNSINTTTAHPTYRLAFRSAIGVAGAIGTLVAAQVFAQSAAGASDTAKMAMPAGKSMMEPTDMSKSMAKMNDKMSGMSMTGNQDMDFAMMMKMHHEGAIDMAQAELDHGKDPMMRAAAKKIIAAQKKEIAGFDRWMSKQPGMKSDAMTK